MLLKNVVQRVN